MSIADDGVEVVRWAEAVRLMSSLLPHIGDDDVQVFEDILTLISKELVETGERIIKSKG